MMIIYSLLAYKLLAATFAKVELTLIVMTIFNYLRRTAVKAIFLTITIKMPQR